MAVTRDAALRVEPRRKESVLRGRLVRRCRRQQILERRERAAAILDRLLDRATVINIKGPSWRLREHEALTKPITDLAGPPEKAPKRRS